MADITPTGTDIQISTDSAFNTIVMNETGPYKTTRVFAQGALPYGVDLYARVRHSHPFTGATNWSASTCFKIIIPANVIGVCIDNSGSSGVVSWIDALGNKLDYGSGASFEWTKHPVFMGISMATVDDARSPVTMTKIPLFYIRTATSGPVGTFSDGKKCWWLSDLKAPGYRAAACFKRSTSKDTDGKYAISPFCYIGTFLGHTETVGGVTCLGSKRNQTVAASQTKATIKTYIANRNNASAGATGFRMFDIWDMSALRFLLLIAKGGTDSQTNWGDNATPLTTPKTGSTNARAVFKGSTTDPQISIDDLWRCYWYYTDLISVSATGVVSLTSPQDLSTAVSFGNADAARYTQPTSAGWIRDVLDCPMVIGDDTHDLMELFLPKILTSSVEQATFSDKFVPNGGDVVCGMSCSYNESYQSYEQTGTTSQQEAYQSYEQTGTKQEAYQSYEQTGSTSVSYAAQYSANCPNRKSAYSLYGMQCKGFNEATNIVPPTPYCMWGGGANGWKGERYYICPQCMQMACTLNTSANYGAYFNSACVINSSGNTTGSCNYTYTSTPVYGYVTRYRDVPVMGYVTRYKTVSVPVMGYVTRTRTANYTTEPGIFAMGLGVPTSPSNIDTVAGRISKN